MREQLPRPLTRKAPCPHPLSLLHLLVSPPPSQAPGFSQRGKNVLHQPKSGTSHEQSCRASPAPEAQGSFPLSLYPSEWSRETKPLCSFLGTPSAALPTTPSLQSPSNGPPEWLPPPLWQHLPVFSWFCGLQEEAVGPPVLRCSHCGSTGEAHCSLKCAG